jgi:hypothetical protein
MRSRWLLACGGALLTLLLASRPARAHGEDDRQRPERPRTSTAGEEPGAEVDEETRWSVGLDFVAGFGKTTFADVIPPGSANVNPVNTIGADPVQVNSFLFSLGYEPIRHLGLGVRMPLTLGTVSPDTLSLEPRTVEALGNVELEIEGSFELTRHLELVLSAGFALPTATGTELPETAGALPANLDQTSYDRFSLEQAAAASRGFEENALFFTHRFGIIPKVALEYKLAGLRLEPYAKVENMISTSSSNKDGYIGELVLGGRVSYLVTRWFEPGVRIWTTIVLTPADQPVAVVEPEIRFHYAIVTPYVGGILPFAGPLAHDPMQFAGLRLGAALAF